jgi:UDP-2,4-diacetamido-2,4,6-trideoxy-beta-L-altropyranose hydrolase
MARGHSSQNTLLIRADAYGAIGGGHLMRCLALAQEWRRHGAEVVFLGRCEGGGFRERIEALGARLVALPAGVTSEEDIRRLAALISELTRADQAPVVVLDGYAFGSEYQLAVKRTAARLLVINDNGEVPVELADFLLNPNLHAADIAYTYGAATVPLLGPQYTLLRGEFLATARRAPESLGEVRRLLVSCGAVDHENVAAEVLALLEPLPLPGITLSLLVGRANRHVDALQRRAAASRHAVEILVDPPDLPQRMADMDLAVSAAGVTCLELAYLGVPLVVFSLADNQVNAAAALTHAGVAVNAGWYRREMPGQLPVLVPGLIQAASARRAMAANGQRLIDGRGAERVWQAVMANHR